MKIVILIAISLTISCLQIDISSFSNIDEINQQSIYLDLRIDFDNQRIFGEANILFKALKETNQIILDTKGLDIKSITDFDWQPLDFKLNSEKTQESLGTPLEIKLGKILKENETIRLVIRYIVNKDSKAIQWLTPEMTLGKKYPFMYSQGEAINSRAMLPCQDSPSVKVAVKAEISVKYPLVALLAGIKLDHETIKDDYITYYFEVPNKIATYLITIAAGDLQYRKISERSGVWSEKEIVDASRNEFQETEKFIQSAEAYLTPYEWKQYNILVLPPGFPYGGMENPCLTFATPALIAGDRSLANVIAHEISHSWTGNLVTMADWRNFWLNEGFTVFVERKIIELVYGEDMAKLQATIGYNDYKEAVKTFGEDNSYTSLYPDIQNNDPDDAFSSIPYEKGFNFLYFLQTLTGKDKFQNIMKNYIINFRGKSIVYIDFKNFFESQVKQLFNPDESKNILEKIDWDSWILKPGYPPITNDFSNKWLTEANAYVSDILNGKITDSFIDVFKKWNTSVKLVFLNKMGESKDLISDDIYSFMKEKLELHEGYNAEVENLWYQLALNTNHDDVIDPYVINFLSRNGRMKYIRPIYKSFARVNKQKAWDTFQKNKPIYHPVAVRLIENDFKTNVNKFIELL